MTFEQLMDAALIEAERARDAGEVPIGAVVALGGEIVGRGYNHPISAPRSDGPRGNRCDPRCRAAPGNYRLTGATLCVTIEPCLMCVGALVHARIATLVYGAAEPRTGAVVSTVHGGELPGHNHRFEVVSGVLEEECRALMQTFFRDADGGASAGCWCGCWVPMRVCRPIRGSASSSAFSVYSVAGHR